MRKIILNALLFSFLSFSCEAQDYMDKSESAYNFKPIYDTIYLSLSGSNANQNINIGVYDLKATSFTIGANTLTTSEWAYLDGIGAYVYRSGGTDVAVADGGTGLSSWTLNGLLYASGTGTLTNSSNLTYNGTTVTSLKNVYINLSSTAALKVGSTPALQVDTTNNRVGVGVAPAVKFDVLQSTLGSEVCRFESTATQNPTYRIFQNFLTTTNNTQTTFHTITLDDDTVYLIEARVNANSAPGSERASYIRQASYFRVSAGVATIVGTINTAFTAETDALWDCTFTVSGSDVRVSVTGDTANSVLWNGTIIVQKLYDTFV